MIQDVIKINPYKHQVSACESALKRFGVGGVPMHHKGYALLMEMGAGKTLTSILITGNLKQVGYIHKVLIVAPLSVVGVWKSEFVKFANFKFDFTVLEGTSVREKQKKLDEAIIKIDAYPENLSVIAINYESAWRMEDALLKYDADLIIADEGHKLKENRSAQSKSMHILGDKARFKLLLTGTPITNRELDIYSEYRFCDASIFGTNFFVFRNTYFFMGGYQKHEPIFKKSLLPEFTKRLHSIAYRVSKAECLDLPECIEEERVFELEPQALKIYKQLEDECCAMMDDGGEIVAKNVLEKYLRLSQLTGGYLTETYDETSDVIKKVSDAKMNMLKDIVTSCIEENQKVVIMTRFIAEMDEIEAYLKTLKRKDENGKSVQREYACIRGGVKDRQEQCDMFQNNPECMVFLGQIQAAGMGITLTAAHIMVFYSLDYNMSTFDQAKARIHRPGQKEKCQYIYLIAKSTVDRKVIRALRHKVELAKLIVDEARKGLNPFREGIE